MSDPRRPDPTLHQAVTKRRKVVARRPSMRRSAWWSWTIALLAAGALIGWATAGEGDGGWRVAATAGGIAVIGMLVVEAVWERRHDRAQARRLRGDG